MNRQMLEVMRRRAELQAKIAMQRGQVAEIGRQWQAPLAIVDQCLSVVCFVRSNPVLVAGVAALLVIRRRGISGLVKGVWCVWKAYRYFNTVSSKLASRLSL